MVIYISGVWYMNNIIHNACRFIVSNNSANNGINYGNCSLHLRRCHYSFERKSRHSYRAQDILSILCVLKQLHIENYNIFYWCVYQIIQKHPSRDIHIRSIANCSLCVISARVAVYCLVMGSRIIWKHKQWWQPVWLYARSNVYVTSYKLQ